MGGHTLQKAATLLPRNVPRTVRVRPTKQGNGNPTKGALSLSLHSTMAQCYLFDVLPPCCVFPILPETFFHPSPPYHPFVSTPRSLSLPFLLPIISRYFQQSRRNFVAHSNLRRPLRSLWPTYVLGRCSALSNRVRWDRR